MMATPALGTSVSTPLPLLRRRVRPIATTRSPKSWTSSWQTWKISKLASLSAKKARTPSWPLNAPSILLLSGMKQVSSVMSAKAASTSALFRASTARRSISTFPSGMARAEYVSGALDQAPGEVVVLALHPRRAEEVPAAEGDHVLVQVLAVRAALDGGELALEVAAEGQ